MADELPNGGPPVGPTRDRTGELADPDELLLWPASGLRPATGKPVPTTPVPLGEPGVFELLADQWKARRGK